MQTVMPHENHIDSFILAHTQFLKIINVPKDYQFSHPFCPIRIATIFGAILIAHFSSH